MSGLNQSLSDLDVFKEELVKIVISEKSDEDKIKELRTCILKFKPIQVKLTLPSSDVEIRDKLNEATLLVLETIKEYSQFKQKVTDIIRDNEMTVENKIEQISNVLM
jgi:hypothetical protein